VNISFDPMSPSERKLILWVLQNVEQQDALPPGCKQLQLDLSMPAPATVPAAAPLVGESPDQVAEKRKRTRRTREQIAMDNLAAEAVVPVLKVDVPADLFPEVVPVPAPVAAPVVIPVAPPAPPPVKTYTKDDVRACLVAYAEKHGQDKARGLMREHGKAEKLSDIQPILYADLIAAAGG
jgi:hypothetical protein